MVTKINKNNIMEEKNNPNNFHVGHFFKFQMVWEILNKKNRINNKIIKMQSSGN